METISLTKQKIKQLNRQREELNDRYGKNFVENMEKALKIFYEYGFKIVEIKKIKKGNYIGAILVKE